LKYDIYLLYTIVFFIMYYVVSQKKNIIVYYRDEKYYCCYSVVIFIITFIFYIATNCIYREFLFYNSVIVALLNLFPHIGLKKVKFDV
jgi:hypothetical protein